LGTVLWPELSSSPEHATIYRIEKAFQRRASPSHARRCLADVLARVQDHPARKLDELLPGAWAAARDDE
jgi:hypothetical protein